MDYRDVLIDGIQQLNDWVDDALKDLTADQVNWLPDGKTTSIGFNAWHIMRTSDNIVNFVFQERKPPLWQRGGYVERMGLPPVAQGTGMGLEEARALTIGNVAVLREYGRSVGEEVIAFLKQVPLADLDAVQMVKPLGEMPKWRVVRQVMMTHGFMHLGEINLIKGTMGLQFSI